MHGPFYKRKIDIVLKAYLSLLLVSYFLNVLASDSSPFGCLSLVFLAHSACPPPALFLSGGPPIFSFIPFLVCSPCQNMFNHL